MKNKKWLDEYFVYIVFSIIILFGICCFSFSSYFKQTWSSFGGTTGTIYVPCDIIYYSNYPDDTMVEDVIELSEKKQHVVLSNTFTVLDGYKFINWNTSRDGSGDVYNNGDIIELKGDVFLYAQWEKIVIAYGDINLNGIIDEEDYLLLEKHVLGTEFLTGQALLNADVNVDKIINTVDIDIIQQAYKGTEGYVGFLPDEPILIYSLYEESEVVPPSDDTEDGNENNNDSNTGSNGSGNSGSGNGSSGQSGTNKNPNVNGSNSNGNNSSNNTNNENKTEVRPTNYEFRFYYENMEYAMTRCDVSEDGTCKLVFPNVSPSKVGYNFIGWSDDKSCPKDKIINEDIVVSGNGNYYACFSKIPETIEKEKKDYSLIVIVLLWLMVIVIITRLVLYFKNKSIKD